MRTSRLFAVGALFVSFAWLLAGGCSASDQDSTPGLGAGGSSGKGGGSQGGSTTSVPDASTNGGNALGELNPLCGVGVTAGLCVPDLPMACRGFMPPSTSSGGAGGMEGGAGGMTVVPSDGGNGGSVGGVGAGGLGGLGGVGGAAEEGGAGGGAGASGAAAGGDGGGGPLEPQAPAAYGCQVTRQGGLLQRQCVEAGKGNVNAPCFGVSDCAAGFACVTEHGAGRCLPYCCHKDTICTSNTYCAERPLRVDVSNTDEQLRVPVCVPADGCSLEEPFPCPSGSDCRCQSGTACMVVRDDGTTSCVEPGEGQQGDPCPCAWNHVCSGTSRQCLKICRTDAEQADCGEQKCQASSELPRNFGVCVGPVR